MTSTAAFTNATLAESVVVVTDTGTYEGTVILTFANGSRNISYTDDAGVVHIIRTKVVKA